MIFLRPQTTNLLEQRDEGIHVCNLQYCNFSDRTAWRMTGLTGFATFWIEQGKIVAPLNVMHFDDNLYQMLGSHLIGLIRETEGRCLWSAICTFQPHSWHIIIEATADAVN